MKFKTGSRSKRAKPDVTKKVAIRLPGDYPWKVLTAMVYDLSDMLSEDDIALMSQIIRDRDIAAIAILGDLWGLQNISIDPCLINQTLAVKRAKYQISGLLKKYCFDTEKDKREANAMTKFVDAEAVCQAYNQEGYKALCWGETETDACCFSYAKSFLSKLLGEKSPTKQIVTHWSRHGPGSNLDTCEGQSNTYFKYANWPYSCTPGARPYARFLIETDGRWMGFLEDDYRTRFNIPKHAILDREEFWKRVFKYTFTNRITFVPKNAQTERSIAIEPSMNLMLQLGVDGFIRKRLKRWDIDLDDQTKNQLLAYRGSIDPTPRSFVTLDLAAASDTLSLKLCELLLPSVWYDYLLRIRSPKGVCGGARFQFEKISSMGNGSTFVLESAIFAALTYGAIRARNGSCSFQDDFSIFGDDIICRQEDAEAVIRSLSNAGLSLNEEKSFLKGDCRESCGSDWIQGKPVRPVFLKHLPTDAMELFNDYNRLKRILSLRWGIEESETLSLMTKWIPTFCMDLYGPVSDEEFDSYLHRSRFPTGFDNCMYKYKRLTREAISMKERNFLCRKLMHDLRGVKIAPGFVSRRKAITGKSSRFTVCKSYSYTVGTTYSYADIWRTNYAEQWPWDKPKELVQNTVLNRYHYNRLKPGC